MNDLKSHTSPESSSPEASLDPLRSPSPLKIVNKTPKENAVNIKCTVKQGKLKKRSINKPEESCSQSFENELSNSETRQKTTSTNSMESREETPLSENLPFTISTVKKETKPLATEKSENKPERSSIGVGASPPKEISKKMVSSTGTSPPAQSTSTQVQICPKLVYFPFRFLSS